MNIVVLKSIDLLVFFVPPIFFCHLMPEREREREREREGGGIFCKNDLVVVCEQHNKSLFFKGDRKPQTLCPQF